MKAPPSVILGLLLVWSTALLSARSTGGAAGGATLIYTSTSAGTLYLSDGSSTPYTGGDVTGASQLTIYTRSNSGVLTNLGTLTRTAGIPLAVTTDPTTPGGVLSLAAGSNFLTAGTLSLGTGSSVSFDGQLNSGNTFSVDSGATLVASAFSQIGSNVALRLGTASTLTIAGTLTLGAGSIIDSNGTLSLGSNATVANGILTFGTGGTIATGGVLNVGAGSTLSNSAGLYLNGTTGGSLSIVSGTLPTLGVGAANTGNLIFTGPTTIAIGTGSIFAGNHLQVPISTAFNINLSPSILLNKIPLVTGPSSAGTAIRFLDGFLTNGGTISLLYLPAVQNLTGNPVSVHISEFDTPGVHDKYVLQLSFDPAAVATMGDVLDSYLAWFDPSDSTWKNAVDGNSDGGASAHFVAGAYDPSVDFNLGYYGVDTANSTVWAVVDHNSEFGVVTPAPEPATGTFLVCGLALLARRSRKR
ncbi:MAG: hypothetical protein WDN28_29630 [Chthoniobacter sp.]